jgi:hypothetical protein
MAFGRFALAALYLAGAWIALTTAMYAVPWMPVETAMQSAKYLALGVSSLVFAVCVFGATTMLLGLSGMTARPEVQPRPYRSDATPLA